MTNPNDPQYNPGHRVPDEPQTNADGRGQPGATGPIQFGAPHQQGQTPQQWNAGGPTENPWNTATPPNPGPPSGAYGSPTNGAQGPTLAQFGTTLKSRWRTIPMPARIAGILQILIALYWLIALGNTSSTADEVGHDAVNSLVDYLTAAIFLAAIAALISGIILSLTLTRGSRVVASALTLAPLPAFAALPFGAGIGLSTVAVFLVIPTWILVWAPRSVDKYLGQE